METVRIRRNQLRRTLDRISRSGIFSVCCARRGDLLLRYLSSDPLKQGPLAHVGDHSRLDRRRTFVRGSGSTIVLEPAGSMRVMTVQAKRNIRPTKHWESKGKELTFDPREHKLYHVYGMYSDGEHDFGNGRRPGRNGDYARWVFICLPTTRWVKSGDTQYVVI